MCYFESLIKIPENFQTGTLKSVYSPNPLYSMDLCITNNRQSLLRFRRRLRALEQNYQDAKIDAEKLAITVQTMLAHIDHANTRRLKQSLIEPSLRIG